MRRLPNVDNLVAQIKNRAAKDMEKTAGETAVNAPQYTTQVALAMYKLAQCLRATDVNMVSYGDVNDFTKQLMGETSCN
jgi:hypothetical protein